MYNRYNDQSSEYMDSVQDNQEYGNYPPMDNGPDFNQSPFEPQFNGQPPMHGGPHHGPHPDGPGFEGRPPMHGGPHHGPHPDGPGFESRPPMHGGPHFGPRPEGPGFGVQPPMYGNSENSGSFRELPFDIPGHYEMLPVDGKLMHNFRLLSHRIHAVREGAAGQRRILTILSAVPAVSQRQLMELLGVRAGTLSEVIGKLEAAGKVRRMPNPNDRRVLMVSITPEGLASVNESKEAAPDLFEALTDNEKQTLLTLLEKILAGKSPSVRTSSESFEC